MKNLRIAARYSKALFLLSKELNIIETIHKDMILVEEVIKNSPDFKSFLICPVIKEDKKLNVIQEIFGNKINELTLKFLNIIVGKRRFLYIDAIANEFINLYRIEKGVKAAHIQTVMPLKANNKEEIIKILKEFSNSEIELIEELRKELIGGFVINLDNIQYDASIKAKITKLTKEYSVNVYEKGL